jgi:hypothetical protein
MSNKANPNDSPKNSNGEIKGNSFDEQKNEELIASK